MRNDNVQIDLATPEKAFQHQLRKATHTIHQQLENSPISRSLMDEQVILEDYLFYLQCMKDVVKLFDEWILPQIRGILPDADARRKLPAILHDIQTLQEETITLKPVVPLPMPEIPNIARAMGMAYVIEGSTLGGRIILKRVSERLQLNSPECTSFFTGYSEQTGSMWKSFMDALTAYAINQHQQEEIIAGAVECFTMIHSHFMQNSRDNED
jgi:heme oxygenase